MSDCSKAIRSAVGDDTITEAQATEILTRMQNSAKARQAKKGIRYDEAIKEIAGEMRAGADPLSLIDKRNRLLSAAAMKRQLTALTTAKIPMAKALKNQILLTDANIVAMEKRMMTPLVAKLMDLGLMKEFQAQKYGKEFTQEIHNIEGGGTKPVVEGEIGRKLHELAKFVLEARAQHNAMLNRYGAYYPEVEHYGFRQTYSKERLWKLGGKRDADHKSRTRAAFMDLVGRVNIDPRTFEGRDKDLFWSRFFDNVYAGKHVNGVVEDLNVDQFSGIHGSLANKLSEGRLLWFADAESQWKWNEVLGSKGPYESVTTEFSNAARAAVLMRDWGPNWQNNMKLVHQKALELSVDRPDSAMQVQKLNAFQLDSFMGILSGSANISNRPTLSQIVDDGIRIVHMNKMGGVVISSFGDTLFTVDSMMANGMGLLDALGAMLDVKKLSREEMLGVNVMTNSFIGSLTNRYGLDPSSSLIARGAHKLHDWNLFNTWNDILQRVTARTMSWWTGQHSGVAFADLPEGLRTQFGHADIGPADWDAIRSIAKTVDKEVSEDMASDGKKFIFVDQLKDVSDDLIDRIITERGMTVTPANRRRTRDDLEIRLSSYFSQQVDNAMNAPDLETKYWTGRGLQAGTWPATVAKLVMVFKSFPIRVLLGTKRRAQDAGVTWANLQSGDWGKRQNSFLMNRAMLIAAVSAAGYVSITSRDLLNGRTRRKLLDENGTPNVKVFMAAIAKGGGLGIMGDFLFSEYDRQYKSALNLFAGPVFGMADQLGSIYTGTLRAAGDETIEKPASELANLAANNIPFANLFYIKPFLNHFIWYNMREALSPGVLKRAERTAREMNYQDFWIEPSEVAAVPVTDVGRKFELGAEKVAELFGAEK